MIGNLLFTVFDKIILFMFSADTKAEMLICLKSGILYFSRVMLLKAWQVC